MRHLAFFRPGLKLLRSPVSPYRCVFYDVTMFLQRNETWEGNSERESTHTHTRYIALICRRSRSASEAICSMPSTTHGQTKRSLTNCFACNPHLPFTQQTNKHAGTNSVEPVSRVRKVTWEPDGFWVPLSSTPIRFRSPFSRPAKCLINKFNQISKQPKIDAFH